MDGAVRSSSTNAPVNESSDARDKQSEEDDERNLLSPRVQIEHTYLNGERTPLGAVLQHSIQDTLRFL